MTKRMTTTQLKALRQRTTPKRPKYGNHIVERDGMKFGSEKERGRYDQLKLLERAGQISGLNCQMAFEIIPAVELDGVKRRARKYVADFVYLDAKGQFIVEDVKSPATRKNALYLLKRHLMKHVHDIEIVEL